MTGGASNQGGPAQQIDWQRGAIRLSSFPMGKRINRMVFVVGLIACARLAPLPARAADQEAINPPPSAQDWQALGKLPDWSGVWTPVISDQVAQEKSNRPPWTPQVAKQIDHMYAEEAAGRPFPIIDHCFPTGMPSWMLITHQIG